ncbi:MAG: CsbD family protein [Janthinobacterium lividum]
MDEDRIKGAATNIGGKVKDAVGGLTGDTKTQAEGKADQAKGRVQNTYGSAKDNVSEVADSLGSQLDTFLKDKPVAALLSAVGVGYVLARLMHRR